MGILLLPLVPFFALGDFLKVPYVGIRTMWMIWKGYCTYMADGSFDFQDIQQYFFRKLFLCLGWYAEKTGLFKKED